MECNLKYIDPSYIIRSVPASPQDNVYCSRLAQNAVHAAMAGKTGMLVGRWHGTFVHLPLEARHQGRRKVDPGASSGTPSWKTPASPPSCFNVKKRPAPFLVRAFRLRFISLPAYGVSVIFPTRPWVSPRMPAEQESSWSSRQIGITRGLERGDATSTMRNPAPRPSNPRRTAPLAATHPERLVQVRNPSHHSDRGAGLGRCRVAAD